MYDTGNEYRNRTFPQDRSNFNSELKKEVRVMLIANDIAKGLTRREIVAKYIEEWGLSPNAINSYIAEAIMTFADDEMKQKLQDINIERLTTLYREALEQGKTKDAIRIIDILNKTAGVYTQKVEVSSGNEFTFSFGDELQQ